MKNYINIRIQAHNHQKAFNSIKHNLRIIASLSDDLKQFQHTQTIKENEEKGIESDKDFNLDCTNYIYYNTDNLTNDYALEDINNANKRDIYNVINDSYKLYRKAHNEIYKKWNDNKNIRDRKSTWAEGVLTFSEKLKVDFEKGDITKEQLMKVAIECVEDITKQYGEGAKINYIVLHLQEKTPHFHFSFNNFDERGNSLTHINRETKFLSNLQDIAFKHFNEAFKMERGVKKDKALGNIPNYTTIENYHRKNITQLKIDSEKLEIDFKELKTIIEAKSEEYAKKHNLYLDDSKKLDSKIEELSSKHKLADDEIKSLENEIKLNKEQKDNIKKDTTLTAAARKEMYIKVDKCNKINRAQRDIALRKKRQYKDGIIGLKTQHNTLINELKTLDNEIKGKKAILEQKRKQEETFFNVNDYSKFDYSKNIERIENIYLNCDSLFGGFNKKRFYEDMQEEFNELLSLPLKLKNLQDKLEIKNNQLMTFSNERENLIKLSNEIDKKDLEISKQNKQINQLTNQLKTLIDENIDLRTKKDNLELVVENLIKKFAPGEIETIEQEEIDSDIRTMNLSLKNNERTLSSNDLLTKLNSLSIDNTLKQAITNHIKKHK